MPSSAIPSIPDPAVGPFPGRDFAAVLFDMDGTLVDSTPVVVRSWVRWAEEVGVDPYRLVGNHGVPARAIVEKLVAADRVEDALARIVEIETADVDGIVPLPGAAAAVDALTAGDVQRWAIVTSSTSLLAAARIGAAELTTPAVLVTADDVERGKPHPDPWLLAAERIGVDPADCLVVEDAPSGLEAARAAGAATLAVTTTTAREELVADHVVGTLADVRFELAGGRVRVTPSGLPENGIQPVRGHPTP
jgi:sugar-phosphatase